MAKGINKHLLNDEKIEYKTPYKLKLKERSGFESGFTAYITNKRVIFYKDRLLGFVLHDMTFKHLAGANVRRDRIYPMVLILGFMVLILGFVLPLMGSILCVPFSLSLGIFTAFVGVILIVISFLITIETLILKGAGVEIKIRANSENLHDLLKMIRNCENN